MHSLLLISRKTFRNHSLKLCLRSLNCTVSTPSNKCFFFHLIYFWLHWVFAAVPGLSLFGASGGDSRCSGQTSRAGGFSLRSTGSGGGGFSSGSEWAQWLWLGGTRARAQQLWCTGLAASRYVQSFWTRDQACVPCFGRRIPIYCTTREVSSIFLQPKIV